MSSKEPLNKAGDDSKNYGAAKKTNDDEIDPAIVATGHKGLTSSEAAARLIKFGPNDLPEKEDNKLLKFLIEFIQPMPLIIWLAIAIEMTEYCVEKTPSALLDAMVLMVLQILNVVIGFLEELKAGEEVAALRASLKPEACVIRDGNTNNINAAEIVPGDRVILCSGAAVPADCMVAEGEKPIQVDQAAMTGESLPVTMRPGCIAKMGSTITRGESEAIVHYTGAKTFLGKTAALIHTVDDQPHFELVLGELLITLVGLGAIVCCIIFMFLYDAGEPPLEVLAFNVVLLIASIPVALRVVCTCTLALGCKELAAEKAIVARLSSVEEFAGMDILCSDKTGTLTLNKMELQKDLPLFDEKKANRGDVLTLAALAAKWWEPPKDALDTLVLNAVDCKQITADGYKQTDYVPFDPSIKRTEATIQTPEGKMIKVMKGAPDVVLNLATGNRDAIQGDVDKMVLGFAQRGIRSLAISRAEGDGPFFFLGILTFLDPPRPDTRVTIEKANELGVAVKMITGDHKAIAIETSRVLGLGMEVEGASDLPSLSIEEMSSGGMNNLGADYGKRFEECDGFAQVFPEHKYLIVEALRQRGHLVGMTGDGVNDAPALKRADVGIAVCGATSAAQAASDIVLTRPGLSTIVTALFTSRRIFQRMKNFVIYRVACTEQLLFFFFFSCLFFNPGQENHQYAGIGFFSIPVIALVSITILNDGTIVSVAYDHVDASATPEKWNLRALYVVSTAIGATALASSLGLLYLALHCDDPTSTWRRLGLPNMAFEQVQTLMYLKISLSDYASVFNARCQGWMWSRAPSTIVLASAAFAMGLATLLSILLPPGMAPIDCYSVAFVWSYVLVWAFIQDAVKVATYGFLRMIGSIEETRIITEEEIQSFQSAAQHACRGLSDV